MMYDEQPFDARHDPRLPTTPKARRSVADSIARGRMSRNEALRGSVDRLTHFLDERAKLTALDQEEIAGLHGGAALVGLADEPHAAALLRSDLVLVLDALRRQGKALDDILAMSPPELLDGDDEELHATLNDGWTTAHHEATLMIKRQRLG